MCFLIFATGLICRRSGFAACGPNHEEKTYFLRIEILTGDIVLLMLRATQFKLLFQKTGAVLKAMIGPAGIGLFVFLKKAFGG